MTKLWITAFAIGLCFGCDNEPPPEAAKETPTPTQQQLVVSPAMQQFTATFKGNPDALAAVLKKHSPSHPELLDKDGETYGGTIAFMRDLKNCKVTDQKMVGSKDCYILSGEEFPEDPEEHTLHNLKVCWDGGEVVSLNSMTFGSSL